MTKKSLIVFAALFSLYSLSIGKMIPNWGVTQSNWQSNLLKAEKYIYNDTDMQNVIIGSSLANVLISDSLPMFYNLAFPAQSVYEGFSIINKRESLPKNLFIEMNVAYKLENTTFTSSLSIPGIAQAKDMFLSLRADKQPIAIMGDLVNYQIVIPFLKMTKSHLSAVISPEKTSSQKDESFQKALKFRIKDIHSSVPDIALLNKNFSKMKDYVSYLEKKNVNVVFFEMPINDTLWNSPASKTIREKFYEYFPQNKYHYIPLPPFKGWETSDGIHLKGEEAIRYTHYFKEQSFKFIN